jgi:uncharacterized protein (DUF1697 family)
MTTYVALLRGVNVAGRTVPMAALRAMFRDLGHERVTSYIQSGNVVFRTPRRDLETLVNEIRSAIGAETGHLVTVVLRTAHELAQVVGANPFIDGRDPRTLHVTFLAQSPDPILIAAIAPAIALPDEFRGVGQEVFVACPNGYGRTTLNNAFFERRLGVAATTRNWRTVTMLARLAGADDDAPGE